MSVEGAACGGPLSRLRRRPGGAHGQARCVLGVQQLPGMQVHAGDQHSTVLNCTESRIAMLSRKESREARPAPPQGQSTHRPMPGVTLLSAGIHVVELVTPDVADLASDGTLRVGSEEAARDVPLDEIAFRALHDWLGVREDPGEPKGAYLFLSRRGRGPLSTRQVQALVKKHARAAGLQDVNTQALRHTFARRLYERRTRRKEVRRLLGLSQHVDKGEYGVVDEDTGPNRCTVCGVEMERRSTWCRRHAVLANWATPGFRERWKRARFGD
jgi:hypothetical protein